MHQHSCKPVIGITVNNKNNAFESGKYESDNAYARAVTQAGGVPVLLSQNFQCIEDYLRLCDGFVFTGGADPRMEIFGHPTHTAATLVAPERQRFDMALLEAIESHRNKTVLGICLGMQLMALLHQGTLHQHLPDFLPSAKRHQDDQQHSITFCVTDSVLVLPDSIKDAGSHQVVSWHHQAVDSTGTLRKVAVAFDQTVEAVDDPTRPFYAGVQWHPERGDACSLNQGLFNRFVTAAAATLRRQR